MGRPAAVFHSRGEGLPRAARAIRAKTNRWGRRRWINQSRLSLSRVVDIYAFIFTCYIHTLTYTCYVCELTYRENSELQLTDNDTLGRDSLSVEPRTASRPKGLSPPPAAGRCGALTNSRQKIAPLSRALSKTIVLLVKQSLRCRNQERRGGFSGGSFAPCFFFSRIIARRRKQDPSRRNFARGIERGSAAGFNGRERVQWRSAVTRYYILRTLWMQKGDAHNAIRSKILI